MTLAKPMTPPQASAARPARIALFLLLAINLFNYLDRQVLAAVVPQIKAHFVEGEHAGDVAGLLSWFQAHLGFKPENALVGVLSMAFMVTYMIFAPFVGVFAGRISRWIIVGTGVILWSLASGASGLAGSFFVLLATRCLVGIGEAAYGPVAPAILSDLFPVERRGSILSVFYLATSVGSALGYVWGEQVSLSSIGSVLGGWTGLPQESWRWAFLLVVPPGILLGVWAFFMKEVKPASATTANAGAVTPASKPTSARDGLKLLARTPSYVWCTLGMCAMTFAVGGIGFWMPEYLSHEPAAGKAPVTIFGAIVVLSGLAGTLAGGALGDKLLKRFPGSYFMVSGAAMILGFPLILGSVMAPFPYAWWCLAGACVCMFFNTGPTNAILANVVPARLRTLGFATNIFLIHALGDVVSPVIIGILADKFGMRLALGGISLIFILSGVFWLLGMRHLKTDTAAAANA